MALGQVPTLAMAKTPRCAGVDYGSGMVAEALPQASAQALREAHDTITRDASDVVSNYLSQTPYAPHVSIIYDITQGRATPAQRALHAFLRQAKAQAVGVSELVYWDDAKGKKTTLVALIDDPAAQLSHLHDAIAQATHIESRFAYTPHVTLAYLKAGARLPKALEAQLRTRLKALHWQPDAFFITNPCGEPIAREHAP